MNNLKKITTGHTDIGGIKLSYEYISGSNNKPTIVCDSGYAWEFSNWNNIRERVASFANVFVYDRAGIGRSEKDDRPRHSKQNVENLRRLLRRLDINPPYLFVGHSYGGVNVRLYAHTYPEEVTGVILLDSCHEDQNKKMVHLFSKEVKDDYFGGFGYECSLIEFEESFEQIRTARALGSIPLIVVTGGKQPHHTPESWEYWTQFQRDLVNLSTDSKHIIVEEAGHAIHIDQPDVVVGIIKDMFDAIGK